MSEVCYNIGAHVQRLCTQPPLAQLVQKVLLIPEAALLASGITIDGTYDQALITDISTESGTQGWLIEGQADKTWINHNNTFVNPADSSPGWTHMIEGLRIFDPSHEKRQEINKLATGGGRVFAIVERMWKGASSGDAFLFLGLKYGLTIPDGGIIDNSGENDGAMVITLQTPENCKEPYAPMVYLDIDYATTQTAVWTNYLATA